MTKSHDDPSVRLEEVEKLTDESALVEVACTDESPRVRLSAISRVEDDQLLLQVVREAKFLDVRLMAVERISSERLIVEILKERANFELIGMCFSRITDLSLIQDLAEDTSCSPVVRRLAVDHYADEAYLAEAYEARTGRKSEKAIERLVSWHGGGLRGVRAIGRFKGSPKALKALGTIAQKGGEEGELAVEYLSRALGSANPKLAQIAADELAVLRDPDVVSCLVRVLDDPKLNQPVRDVLARIGTAEANAALGKN
jgi:hypothetical protein